MIKGGLKGLHPDNEEVNDEIMYWFFAHSFGYTPDQVNALPYDRMIYMMELETELEKQKKQNDK